MATNMQNKLEYSNLLYCNTIAYNQKVLCIAREVELKITNSLHLKALFMLGEFKYE